MTDVLRRSSVAVVLTALALVSMAAVASAAPADATRQSGGAAGVVAAVVQVDDTLNNLSVLSDIGSVEVITVKDSLNNVLQNARFLNNVTVLQDFLNNNDVDVLNDALNNNNVVISDVVAIDVLSGGDLVIFSQ
jgi:hypothetical protein